MCLGRLGVQKISFLDFDTYDPSNLTRQLLGGANDVGSSKVETTLRNLPFHSLRSELDGRELNALTHWHELVDMARGSDALFNCIDVGTVFDFAVNSLSKALEIPLIQGQSAGWSMNAEFYSGKPGQLCSACGAGIKSSFAVSGAALGAICKRLFSWCENEGIKATDVAGCVLSDTMLFNFLSEDPQYKVSGDSALAIVREAMKRALGDKSKSALHVDSFPKFLNAYYECALEELLPTKICSLKDLLFIPRPEHVPTRYIGSWACPCISVASMMVSQFTNFLTVCY
jgi:hypothetical protein